MFCIGFGTSQKAQPVPAEDYSVLSGEAVCFATPQRATALCWQLEPNPTERNRSPCNQCFSILFNTPSENGKRNVVKSHCINTATNAISELGGITNTVWQLGDNFRTLKANDMGPPKTSYLFTRLTQHSV